MHCSKFAEPKIINKECAQSDDALVATLETSMEDLRECAAL